MPRTAARYGKLFSIPTCCLWIALAPAQGQERQDNHGVMRMSILSTPGATCTYKRDGKILGTAVLPSDDNPNSGYAQVLISVDGTASRRDVTVTCEKDGYRKRLGGFQIGYTPLAQSVALCDSTGGHAMSTCPVDRRYWPRGLDMRLTRDPANEPDRKTP